MINPINMTFEYWASTLTLDFPNDIIPIGVKENNWRTWGNIVANSPTFSGASVPYTDFFTSWKDWAERVYAVLG